MGIVSNEVMAGLLRAALGLSVEDDTYFTAMTPAEVTAKFELSSYGGDAGSSLYAPGADGDYDALDPDDPPVTDLGLWSVGAFTNLLPGSLVGESLPAFYSALGMQNETFTFGREILGIPAFRVQGAASTTGNAPRAYAGYAFNFTLGATVSSTHLAVTLAADKPQVGGLYSVPTYTTRNRKALTGKVTLKTTLPASDYRAELYYHIPESSAEVGDAIDIDVGAPQLTASAVPHPVLALSSAATTTKLAAITQREVAVWKPFVVVIKATTHEDPGAHQVFYSLSRSADELIEVYRATSTDQMTLKIRSGGVDYTKTLGSVADSTAFSVAINVFASFTAASLDGGTVQVLTAPKPSGVLTLESIGCKHDGTLQCGGPIAECNLIHPAVWPAAQLEAA